jgi:hypothetical protein
MATFYVKYGATMPSLVTTLLGDDGLPLVLVGTVAMRVKPRFGDSFDKAAIILDQEVEDTQGQVRIEKPGLDNADQPLTPGNYKVEWRYVPSGGELMIFPTEEADFDNPIVDKLVVQKALT